MTQHLGFNLVIVAGGLGSRLAPVTNHIPKFLVNIGKNTGYVEQIRYWLEQARDFEPREQVVAGDYADEAFEPAQSTITVIVHSNYAKLVSEYHKLYFPTIPLTIKTVDEANGSAHAILSTCDHLIGKSVMFSWCDIIPDVPIPLDDFGPMFNGANVIFTNYNNSNRYNLERVGKGWADVRPVLDKDERGGVFGLYWINHFTTRIEYKPGQDFVEVIDQFGKIREQRLEHIIDFGDMPKLVRTRARSDEAREFNTIEFVGDFVVKKATNEQGKKIMAKEISWYEDLGRLTPNGSDTIAVPKAWIGTNGESLILERVQGVPIWKAWADLSGPDRNYVLKQLVAQQNQIFELDEENVDVDTMVADVKAEAGDKLHARYDEIKGVIESFGAIKVVNGVHLEHSDPHECIDWLTNQLVTHYVAHRPPYGFIHGDLQMSNSMVNLETRQVSIIDPRGYFGKSHGRGLKDYDTAKLLYSLTGYDLFNYSKMFHIERLAGQGLDFTIPRPDLTGIWEFMDSHFNHVHRLWLAVIWLGLAAYIKNDPVKSLCAHYEGMRLINELRK